MLVDECVIGGGITAHQLHRRPVFPAFLGIQRQTQTFEQLERMNEALAALRRELLPAQAKKFAILAEGPLSRRSSFTPQNDWPVGYCGREWRLSNQMRDPWLEIFRGTNGRLQASQMRDP